MMRFAALTRNRVMVGLVALFSLGNLLVGEKVPVNGGFGWDGVIYGRWAKDFYHQVIISDISEYSLQRVLPAAVVHYSLRVLGIGLHDRNIILGFGVLNLFLVILAAFLWVQIADELRLSTRGAWLGLTGMFFNFAVLKQAFYYPVQTDSAAFALGTLSLYCFLKGHSAGLLGAVLLGAFAWPTVFYFGLVLFAFPKKEHSPLPARGRLHVIAAGALTLAVVAGIIHFHFFKQVRPSALESKAMPIESLVVFSLMCVAAYLFVGIRTLVGDRRLYDIEHLKRSLMAGRLGLAVIVFAATRFLIDHLSSGEPGPTRYFFVRTLVECITKPAIFLVAHPIYYGPLLILACFLWRPFCREVHRHGVGLTIVMLMGVILSINPESRMLINLWPFFVAFTVKATESLRWKSSPYWVMAGLSLFFSKIWLKINTHPLEGNPLEFPLQRYFMNHGPWMSTGMYLVQGGFVLLTAILFYFLLKKQRSLQEG